MDVLKDNGAAFDTQGFLAACKLHHIDVVWPLRYGQTGRLTDLQPFVRLGQQAIATRGSDDPRPPGRPTKLGPAVQPGGGRSVDDQESGGSSSNDPSGAS